MVNDQESGRGKGPGDNRLPPGQHLVSASKWPTIGEKLPEESSRPWTLTVAGLVEHEITYSLEQLIELSQTEIVTDIHCVTRWSKYDVSFSGVRLADLLEVSRVQDKAKYISFISRSERRHASSLVLNDAIDLGVLIATQTDGKPLPIEKGGPIRSIVPRRYFYKSVKWVERIELIEKDQLGFWESDSGYHNQADPWQEQRFISQSVDKKQARILIESRDFSGRDLLSIVVRDHDLQNLDAREALLRNADFANCNLEQADFSGANLSNASFVGANLSQAKFVGADLEGANLAGADIRGALFEGCSLFGSTFCDQTEQDPPSISNGARFDGSTVIPESATEALTPVQLEYVRTQIEQFR